MLKAGGWYLVGRVGEDVRTYRVATIQACAELDETFERPPGFDLAAWWAASVARFEASLPQGEARIRLTSYGARHLTGPGRGAAIAAAPGEDGWREVTIPVEGLDTAHRSVPGARPARGGSGPSRTARPAARDGGGHRRAARGPPGPNSGILDRGMSKARQPTLFDARRPLPPDMPEGFVYRPDFLSRDEEAELAAWLATLPFAAFSSAATKAVGGWCRLGGNTTSPAATC